MREKNLTNTSLVISLDNDCFSARDLACVAGLYTKYFKIEADGFLQDHIYDLITYLRRERHNIILDMKASATQDTIQRLVSRAEAFGACMITVNANLATQAKSYARKVKILAVDVDHLTDRAEEFSNSLTRTIPEVDGYVCSVGVVDYYRKTFPGKISFCPGVRLPGQHPDNHRNSYTPAEAVVNKVDFMVMGRPIYNSRNPEKIIAEIYRNMNETFQKISKEVVL